MKIKYLPLLLFALATTSYSKVHASFPCNKASTKTERAICSNSDLRELDSRMANLYWNRKNALSEGMAWRELQDSQRDWLQNRNACGSNISCLKGSYYQRLNELEGLGR